eukprot:GHVU01101997.1.p2 GENE.GHVU01101997.1~~GHVU01101997.1.p2  ORF type:complete len:143 (-),score=20.03 GHVU01101997.1:261-689(-)
MGGDRLVSPGEMSRELSSRRIDNTAACAGVLPRYSMPQALKTARALPSRNRCRIALPAEVAAAEQAEEDGAEEHGTDVAEDGGTDGVRIASLPSPLLLVVPPVGTTTPNEAGLTVPRTERTIRGWSSEPDGATRFHCLLEMT